MSSREEILKAIKANKPTFAPLPQYDDFLGNTGDDAAKREKFEEMAIATGGRVIALEEKGELVAAIKEIYPQAKHICSNLPNLDISTIDLSTVKKPHDLENVDLAILPGQFGVAENGAIWITDKELGIRALPFITQHLAIVIPKGKLVWNMHEAYQNIELQRPGYGLFISGPSKTADIEQSLVIGAHGAGAW